MGALHQPCRDETGAGDRNSASKIVGVRYRLLPFRLRECHGAIIEMAKGKI
jgi:hypothetical protein